jgi:hypothetical protein
MQEKRKFQRYLLSIEIDFSHEDNKIKHTTKTKNVSTGGVCITTTAGPLELNGIYTLKFMLPENEEPIAVKARAVWAKGEDVHGEKLFDNGLEFMDLDDKYREAIEEYSIGAVLEK